MTINLDLKILKYLDDGLPSKKNGMYKNEIKVYKNVSSVSGIVDKIIEYFGEITVAKNITYSNGGLSVTAETTADNNLDTESITDYFEKGFQAIADKKTTVIRLGFDDYGNIVPQFGGKPRYVVGVYASITE